MEFQLLRRPKVPVIKSAADEVTFTGLNAETGKVSNARKVATTAVPSTAPLTHAQQVHGLACPVNSQEGLMVTTHYDKLNPLVNLLDLATVAPKPKPAFTLNDLIDDANRSLTMANNLYYPLPSRENFNNFHSTPNAVAWGKKEDKVPPVLHQKNVSEEVEVPEAEPQRVPKAQKLIEMRAMIRETLDYESSEQALSLMESSSMQEACSPYPNTSALFTGGLARFFQGEARSNSPFIQHDESVMTISKTAVFNALREGGKKLSLRAHFIMNVPDLTPLSLTIVELNLSFNSFKSIPVQVLHLPNLVILTLRNNPIMQLPTDMSGLPKLLDLNLSFCLIHYIPDGFFSLPAIEELNLSYNHLTVMPSSLVKLTSLVHLNIEGNQLPALPFSILGLPKLLELSAKNNFMSMVLWSEYSSKTPMKLKDSCAKMLVDWEIEYRPYCTEELSDWIDQSTETCECCGGNLVGDGLVITRSIMERTFGVKNLPLSFKSCSPSCMREYRKMKNLDVAEGSQSSLQGLTLQQLTQQTQSNF